MIISIIDNNTIIIIIIMIIIVMIILIRTEPVPSCTLQQDISAELVYQTTSFPLGQEPEGVDTARYDATWQ